MIINTTENVIQIVILDKDFRRILMMADFNSLQWREKYYGYGDFELHCNKKYAKVLNQGMYVYRADKENMGIIESVKISSKSHDIAIKGRFLEALLETRVLNEARNFNDTAENICRQLVYDYFIEPADTARKIPNLLLGEHRNIGGTITGEYSGDTVGDVLAQILNEQECGCRLSYDLVANKINFEVFQGIDRSIEQKQNDWCIFSTSRHNILDEHYERMQDYRNFAYVGGEEDDNGRRKTVIVDQSGDGWRREIYVNASDLKSEGKTAAEYENMLRDRGLTKLAEYNIRESVDCEIDSLRAGVFSLGDICTYTQPELDITAHGRVTEIFEVVEKSGIRRSVVLGKGPLTVVEKVKRGLG